MSGVASRREFFPLFFSPSRVKIKGKKKSFLAWFRKKQYRVTLFHRHCSRTLQGAQAEACGYKKTVTQV